MPQDKQQDEEELPDNLRQVLEQSFAREEKTRKRHMKILISSMAQICELDEKQTDRLRLASKGAIDRSLKSFRKYMTDRFRQIRRNRAIPVASATIRSGGAAVTEEGIWKQAIERTLNSKQKELWTAEEKSRLEFQHQIMIRSAVSMVDQRVLLSSRQRELIEAWLAKKAPAMFEEQPIPVGPVGMSTQYILPLLAKYPEEDLKKSFTSDQIQAFKELVGRYANLRANGGFSALPAVRPRAIAPAKAAPVKRPAPKK